MAAKTMTVLNSDKLNVTVDTESEQEENLQNEMDKDAAWQNPNSRCKSLGWNARLFNPKVANTRGTDHLVCSDDDDSDNEMCSILPKTRSLGRNESSLPSTRMTVSGRSEAYKELVASSWKTNSNAFKTPSHDDPIAQFRSEFSKSRIENNPFLQLDRNNIIHHKELKSHLNYEALAEIKEVDDSSSSTSSGLPTLGMSVQMRIKIWKKKEEEAKYQARRESCGQFLFRKCTKFDLANDDYVCSSRNASSPRGNSRATQSDDEIIKSHSEVQDVKSCTEYTRPSQANHLYEIIDNSDVESVRLAEASSSSSLSSQNSLKIFPSGSSPVNVDENRRTTPEGKILNVNVEVKRNKRKWKLAYPLSRQKWRSKDAASGLDLKRSNGPETGHKGSKPSPVMKRPHTKKRVKIVHPTKEDQAASDDSVLSPTRIMGGKKLSEENKSKNLDFDNEQNLTVKQGGLCDHSVISDCFSTETVSPGNESDLSSCNKVRNVTDCLGTYGECPTVIVSNNLESVRSIIVNDDSYENSESGKCLIFAIIKIRVCCCFFLLLKLLLNFNFQ